MPYKITARGVIVADAIVDGVPINPLQINDDWYEVLLSRACQRHEQKAFTVPKDLNKRR